MSDVSLPPPATNAVPAVCPLPIETISVHFRKHVDGGAPLPLRMMAAKALVPMGPKELVSALFMLTFDREPQIRETANRSLVALADKIVAVALRDETLEPLVIDRLAAVMHDRVDYLEMIVLNAQTADITIARIAEAAPDRILEIIAQNQLRILREPAIVRALVGNQAVRPSTMDGVCDFCIRSGLFLEDLPAFRAALRRVHGGTEADEKAAAEAQAKLIQAQREAEVTLIKAGATLAEAPVDPDEPTDVPAEKVRRLTVLQQIMKLTVAKKIEWANKRGNKEVRTILLRDPNKLVQLAVIQSPRITEQEIEKLSVSRTLPQEVLKFIYNSRVLAKNYTIKVNLVNNPKVPVAVAVRFLSLLRASELKSLAKNKNIPNALAVAARNLLDKKQP